MSTRSKKRSEYSNNPQCFTVYRLEDHNGVSGVGRVIDGVIFPSGKCVICWRSRKTQVSSVVVYDNYEDFRRVHIDAHPTNRTQVFWFDVKSDIVKAREILKND